MTTNVTHRSSMLPVRRTCGVIVLSVAIAFPAAAGQFSLEGLQSAPEHNRFIVKFRDVASTTTAAQSNALTTALQKASASLPQSAGKPLQLNHLRTLANGGTEIVQTNRPLNRVDSETLIRLLAADPKVEYVEVDAILKPYQSLPNDPYLSLQWAFGNTVAGINIQPAWNMASGNGITIAVIDTGATDHPDLNAKTLPGYDFISDPYMARDGDGRDNNPADEGDWVTANQCYSGSRASNSSWHGTHVAGITGAITNNGIGVAGTAYNAWIVPVRVLGACGGYMSDIADGLIWASGGSVPGVPDNPNPASVINMSLGGAGACSYYMQEAVNGALNRNATVVIAAGNDNANFAGYQPGNCAGVISVAATDSAGSKASFSNYGSVTIAAPGVSIASTWNDGTTTPWEANYNYMSGTSQATPYVAGVVALMQSASSSGLTPAQVYDILTYTATPLPGSCPGGCGAGIVNAGDAVWMASQY